MSNGLFARLKSGLARSSRNLTEGIAGVLTKRKLDDAALDALEETLIAADLGTRLAAQVVERLRHERFGKEATDADIRIVLADEIARTLTPAEAPLAIDDEGAPRPFVVLVVGVNGGGKTTTIGKLAKRLQGEGKSVILAAGDTFRAAATEQLAIWGTRTGSRVIAGPAGGDAAGLAFDALAAAKKDKADVLLIDTAGRLHNKANLMAELEKVVRVLKKADAAAPHAVLLVLDATVGQNAQAQAQAFGDMVGVTGLVMTKLDGTAKGGVLVAIAEAFKLPVHFIGIGEGADDLRPFAAKDFARSLVGLD
ncbi:MAG TPA: signal recognition particle-docking protein FtsY [Stellaceae bacterium]|nr:signal recognition particle-docking protein FtsY [Stellaceae bacterium]